MDPKPTVFIVDDDEAVRKATTMLVRSAGLDVESYGSAREFLESYRPARPGCLVLDVRMPEMNGLELQEKLARDGLRIPVIIVTGHGDVPMAVRAVKKGALDFIEKPFDDQVLLQRIEHAIKLDADTRRKKSDQADIAARLAQLTPREREVMDLLVDGKSSKQIAYQFGLSRKTIDIHRTHIMLKLGIESLADLVRIGLSQKSKPEE
ncbi:MAG: response regulator transcription factor [Planctomycetota bacterium]|jgi:FixJ family two-component response regulator